MCAVKTKTKETRQNTFIYVHTILKSKNPSYFGCKTTWQLKWHHEVLVWIPADHFEASSWSITGVFCRAQCGCGCSKEVATVERVGVSSAGCRIKLRCWLVLSAFGDEQIVFGVHLREELVYIFFCWVRRREWNRIGWRSRSTQVTGLYCLLLNLFTSCII